METTIGGDRLGSGNKMKASFRNYERSTHDLGYTWRSTMSAGTLVPFMSQLALPGDTFDIDLGCSVLTHPTIGPLFGSYKVQLDVFAVPIRLYHSALHSNMLNIGMDMSKIKLPQVEIQGTNTVDFGKPIDNQQINPSSIFSYLGIRGLGFDPTPATADVRRYFNAIPYLAYWSIYKQYYADKQQEIGMMIHTNPLDGYITVDDSFIYENGVEGDEIPITDLTSGTPVVYQTWSANDSLRVNVSSTVFNETYIDNIMIVIKLDNVRYDYSLTEVFESYFYDEELTFYSMKSDFKTIFNDSTCNIYGVYFNANGIVPPTGKPNIETFDLTEIDDMRTFLLQYDPMAQVQITSALAIAPYCLPLSQFTNEGKHYFSATMNQEGLGLKTYQSDLFNNWLNTEWIDGENGINAITAVSTVGDSFTIDELNMAKKVYDMLNRIALSDGTYDAWLSSVYTHERNRGQEEPAYLGGLIKELVFQEVISNAATQSEPLGTLAGRGVMAGKHKGGQVVAKIDEPSYIIGIVSITPRIDYSQGNDFDVNLKTMNDLHKPALDEIGFQPLITDQMAWFDTQTVNGVTTFKSAGKQPAWINYMTNVNKIKGNFADPDNQMFMTLNRRYEYSKNVDGTLKIKDLTTYIDPSKFNHIFADTSLDSQNFWVQIGCDITARRKISAKLIPNL